MVVWNMRRWNSFGPKISLLQGYRVLNKSKRSVISMIMKAWVDRRGPAWERGRQAAAARAEEMQGSTGFRSAEGGGSHGGPLWFCHGCGRRTFKTLKRDSWYILLSYVRSLPRLYIVDRMCAFVRIFLVFPLFYVLFLSTIISLALMCLSKQ